MLKLQQELMRVNLKRADLLKEMGVYLAELEVRIREGAAVVSRRGELAELEQDYRQLDEAAGRVRATDMAVKDPRSVDERMAEIQAHLKRLKRGEDTVVPS